MRRSKGRLVRSVEGKDGVFVFPKRRVQCFKASSAKTKQSIFFLKKILFDNLLSFVFFWLVFVVLNGTQVKNESRPRNVFCDEKKKNGIETFFIM